MPQRGRILIVDDEVDACDTLAGLMRLEGYLVETAADGLKALPKLDAFAPDVVITDLKMPGLDGMGLLSLASLAVKMAELDKPLKCLNSKIR